MKPPKGQKPLPDADWQESRLPGDRSGEGSKDLFKLILRDIRRRAGWAPRKKPDGTPP